MAKPVDIEGLRLFMTRQVSGFVEAIAKPRRLADDQAPVYLSLNELLVEVARRAAAKRAGLNPDEQLLPNKTLEEVN